MVVSHYCVSLLKDSDKENARDLGEHSSKVLNFQVPKTSKNFKKIVSDFEDAVKSLLKYIYEYKEFKNLQRLFYRLQNATNVSEETVDNNIYLYLQSAQGSSFVHVRDPSKHLELLNAYFYLYHFREYTELHFVQLTKFGNKNNVEFSNCIWATMVLSNWKVFSQHVQFCLKFLNNF